MKTKFDELKCSNCYEVVVWNEGDVTFHLPQEMIYTTLGARCGLQCNFEEGSDEFNLLLAACNEVANNMAVIDKILKSNKNGKDSGKEKECA